MDRGHGSFAVYLASIEYHYTVAGTLYRSRRVNFKGYVPYLEKAHRIAASYPPGAEVDVWYDPRDPRQAVLEPGIGLGNCVGVAAGLGLLAGGSIWLRAVTGAA
jgi:hypothetical protein